MANELLDDEVYAQAMSALIIMCVDVLIVDTKRRLLYLAHRRAKPMNGLWCVGGRVRAGESFPAAAVRKLAQETGVRVEETRVTYLLEDRMIWSEREQVPQNVGSDNMCHVYVCELTDGERMAVKLDPREYVSDQLFPYTREDLVKAGAHERLLDLYNTVFG